MNQRTKRVGRLAAIAVVAGLAGSALVAAPAQAADTVYSGAVTYNGAGIPDVDVRFYKLNTATSRFEYYDSVTTAATGAWNVTATIPDGSWAFWYKVDNSAADFSANQLSDGRVSLDPESDQTVTTVFTVAGGVASAATFNHALSLNAGAATVTLKRPGGATFVGNATDGYGEFELYDGYSDAADIGSFYVDGYEQLLNFDGTVRVAHVPAGVYDSAWVDAEDDAGAGYQSVYLPPVVVTANQTTSVGDVTLQLNGAPSGGDTLPAGWALGIAGAPKVGAVLTATSPTAPGVSFTYQWYSSSIPIVGATSQTYVPVAANLGSRVSVKAFVSAAGATTINRSATTAAKVAVGDPDAATVAITGSAKLGGTLKATVTSPLAGTVAYQWYRNGAVIAGADGSSFSLAKGDLGKSIFVSIKSTTQGHSDAVIPSAAVVVAKEKVSLKATTDKTIKTKTVPKVKVTVKPSKSDIGATAKVKVYYTKTKFKSVTVKSGKSATVKLPKLKKGTTTLKIVYPGTAYYAAKTVTIKVKVSK